MTKQKKYFICCAWQCAIQNNLIAPAIFIQEKMHSLSYKLPIFMKFLILEHDLHLRKL